MNSFATSRFRSVPRVATAVLVLAGAYAGLAKASNEHDGSDRRGPDTYTIGLFGDMPYNALGRAQYPALLADINANHVAFSVFDGDLKAGGDGPCSDSLYTTAIANFNTLNRPLMARTTTTRTQGLTGRRDHQRKSIGSAAKSGPERPRISTGCMKASSMRATRAPRVSWSSGRPTPISITTNI
jgi:hypothetical protein